MTALCPLSHLPPVVHPPASVFFYIEPNEGLAESVASARLHHQVFSFEIFPSDSFCSLLQQMFQNILISDFTAVLGIES